jgi:hypothetical protein
MNAKHTAGPWTVDPFPGRNKVIGTVPFLSGEKDIPRLPGIAFDIHNKADAILIAAAPDLLAACVSAVESLEQLVRLNRIPGNNAGLREARAAIARATNAA